jgi:hypothetical protein
MDANMEELGRKGQQSLLLLNELSQHAALLENLAALYNERDMLIKLNIEQKKIRNLVMIGS